ncbi:Histone H1.2 [Arabidopsis thaliana]
MSIEEENVPTTVDSGAADTTVKSPEKKPAAKGGKSKKTTTAKATKKPVKAAAPTKKKTTSSHPTYEEMIKDAIVTLKERTGSSQYAIQKFIEEKHKSLPPTFRKLLLVNLKRLVASEKLVKVKASFKIPSARSAATPKPAAPVKKKTTVVAKPKAKASRTSTRTSPGKKVAAPAKKVAAVTKKAPAKNVKVKSPAKRASTRKAKK